MTENKHYPVRRWDQLCISGRVTDLDHEFEILVDILNASRRRLDKLQALAASPVSGYVYRKAAIHRLYDIGDEDTTLKLYRDIFSNQSDPSIGTRLDAFSAHNSLKWINSDPYNKQEQLALSEEKRVSIDKFFGGEDNYVNLSNTNPEFVSYRQKGYFFA